MSTFFQSLLGQQSKSISPETKQQQQQQPQARDQEEVSYIIHSNYIKITHKSLKGYTGIIKEIIPVTYNVAFEKEVLVPKFKYPGASIGSLVLISEMQKTGKIIKEYPVLYKIKTDKGLEHSLAREYYDRVVRFRHHNAAETGEKIYLTGVLVNQSFDVIPQYTIQIGESTFIKNASDILDEKWRIKGTGTGLDGVEGKMIGTVPEQFVVLVPISGWFPKSYITKKDRSSGFVTILYGDYKGAVGKIVGQIPKTFKITVNALNKVIKTFGNDPITENDFFYNDIVLSGPEEVNVQVLKVKSPTVFTVKTIKKEIKDISTDQIKRYNPGFRIASKKMSEELPTETVVSDILLSPIGEDSITEFEGEQEVEPEGEQEGEPEGEDEGVENEAEAEPEVPEYKLAYKDIERLTKIADILTEDQETIKKIIQNETLIDTFIVTTDDINIRELIADVQRVEKDVVDKLNSLGKSDVFSNNDLKFLVVIVMYHYLIRKGLLRKRLDSVILELIKAKFFIPVDVESSSWYYLNPVAELNRMSFEDKVFRIISICKDFVQSILGEVKEQVSYSDIQIKIEPVRKTRAETADVLIYKQKADAKAKSTISSYGLEPADYPERPRFLEEKKIVRYSDILKGGPLKLQENAKMLWMPHEKKIVNGLRVKLQGSVENKEMASYKDVILYALDHLDNIFIEIEKLKNDSAKTRELSYLKQLATILNREFEKAKVKRSMASLKNKLEFEQRLQKQVAISEGVLPSRPETILPSPSIEESSSTLSSIDAVGNGTSTLSSIDAVGNGTSMEVDTETTDDSMDLD
jgi:ribosomal protein L24